MKQELLAGEQYFTPYGWCEFIAALSDANIIEGTIAGKLTVRMITHGAPTITSRSVRGGVYVWMLNTPVSFTFRRDGAEVAELPDIEGQTLTVEIERSASSTNPDGIGINQWVVVPPNPK